MPCDEGAPAEQDLGAAPAHLTECARHQNGADGTAAHFITRRAALVKTFRT